MEPSGPDFAIAHLQRHVRPAARHNARQTWARSGAEHVSPAVAPHQGIGHPAQTRRPGEWEKGEGGGGGWGGPHSLLVTGNSRSFTTAAMIGGGT